MSASTTALSTPRTQTLAVRRAPPLLAVITWELRRFRASRSFWLQALGFFCFSLLLTWALQAPDKFGIDAQPRGGGEPLSGFVAGTSAWGLLHILPISLVVLVLFLPFVTADGVTRDLQRRTHELLMTTAVPSWAYVWGRYLMSLVISLGLALLYLAAILGMGLLLHLTVTDYPLPQISTVLLLWLGMVVTATILVSSLGFALGTMYPRQSTLIKVMILVAWIVGGVVIPMGLGNITPPTWYVNWDPTSGATGYGLRLAYSLNLGPNTAITTEAQLQQLLLSVENKMPDLAGWFAPHLLLAGLSLLLVALAAVSFQRFRNAFGA